MLKISIIVPVKNNIETFKRCLKSIKSQTLIKSIECLVVDYGSNEKNLELIEKSIKEYNSEQNNLFQLFKLGKSTIGMAKNYAIPDAKGMYISYVYQEDYLINTFCEQMFDKAQKEDLDIVVSNYMIDTYKNISKNIEYIFNTDFIGSQIINCI